MRMAEPESRFPLRGQFYGTIFYFLFFIFYFY